MKKILILLAILLAPIIVKAQNIEGTPPHAIDRAMSPWARDRININFDTIYSDVLIINDSVSNYNARLIILESADSTWLYITVDTIQTKYIKIDPAMDKILFFSLSKMKKGVGNPPDDGVVDGFATLDFDKTTDQEMYSSFFGPLDWKPNSGAQLHLGFFVDAAPVTADTVVWGIEFTSIDPDGIFGFTSTATDLDSVRITPGTPANDKKVHNAILEVPAVDLVEEGILFLRLYRDANNGADTHDADARLFDFHIHYTRDKI